jgi:tetratricopeptide (TPR) repeat protein
VGVKNALALTRTDLATTIAQRELDRIGAIAAGAGVDSGHRQHRGFLARHMAVVATLTQGLSPADARSLIEEEAKRLGSAADIGDTVAALRDGLPGAGNDPQIAPILPDIVGEAAIMLWLGNGGALPELGIDPLASIHRAAGMALNRTSQVLVRTAQDFAAAGRDEPVRWLYAIAQAAETDVGALMLIADELPLHTMALRELAVDLTQSITDRLKTALAGQTGEEATDAADGLLGKWLSNFGVRLTAIGRREEALAASQDAVAIYRRLAATRPDAFLPDLASSLNNISVCLSNLGRREEALAASQEAVAIRRRLAATRPDAFLPDLAMSLNNLGMMLWSLGCREEALVASQEAVAIRRGLAATRPDAFLPDLATSLNNLGMTLSNLGRREEALAASQEAVAIYRRLAGTHPDAFLPDLAASLNNIGVRLSDLGRREEALAASQEAVAITRRLAASRPDAFLPDLARSIGVMSDALAALDRHGEAAQAATQSLEILTPFVERYPQTYQDLARYIAADVPRYCEAAGLVPDKALLARLAKALGGEADRDEAAAED